VSGAIFMFPLLDEKDKRGIAPLVNLLPTQGRLTPLQRSNCAPVFSRSRYRGLFGPRGSSGNRAALEGAGSWRHLPEEADILT